jgi:hypothetical protein
MNERIEEPKLLQEEPLDEQAPDAPEPSVGLEREAAAEAMEDGRIERAGICKRVLTSEIVSNGLDFVPFAGSGKMLVESVAGGTMTGRDLDGKERIVHAAVGAGLLALDFTGLGEAADAVTLVGKMTALVGRCGEKLAEKGAVKAAGLFAKTALFMERHPKLVERAEEFAQMRVREYLKGGIQALNTYKEQHA